MLLLSAIVCLDLRYLHTSFKLSMVLSLGVLILLPKVFKLSVVLRLKMLNQEYALVDGSYFIGLTPVENSQIQFRKVLR